MEVQVKRILRWNHRNIWDGKSDLRDIRFCVTDGFGLGDVVLWAEVSILNGLQGLAPSVRLNWSLVRGHSVRQEI